jgi:hypothetical protein
MKPSIRIAYLALAHLDEVPASDQPAVLDELACCFDDVDRRLAARLRAHGQELMHSQQRQLELANLMLAHLDDQ